MRNQKRSLQRALTSLPSDNVLKKARPLKKPPKRMNSTLSNRLMIDSIEREGSSIVGTSTRDTLTVASSAIKQRQALLLQTEVASLDLSKIPETKKSPRSRKEPQRAMFVAENITPPKRKESTYEQKVMEKFNRTCKESGHLISALFQKKYTLRVEKQQKLEVLSSVRDELEREAWVSKKLQLELEKAQNQQQSLIKEKLLLQEQIGRLEEQKELVAHSIINHRKYGNNTVAKKQAEVKKERGLLQIDLNYLKGKYMELQINGRDKAQLYKKKAAEKAYLKKKFNEGLQRSKSLQKQMSVSQKKLDEFIQPLK